MTLSPDTSARLLAAGLDVERVHELVVRALEEDLLGGVDVTSVATVPFDAEGRAVFVPRAAGVVAGLPVAAAVMEIAADDDLALSYPVADGEQVAAGRPVLEVFGLVRTLLTAERTALNLLGHLSGIATLTAQFVAAAAGRAVVLDTRKTTPGLRSLEKYAVRQGGGQNKRLGLSDVALVKDNHVLAAGGVAPAFRAVRATFPEVEVQVECDDLDQVRQALEAGASFLLCDNMSPALLREAVGLARGRAQVEATGGITLATAAEVAGTGVDFFSVGALTSSAPVLDIGVDLAVL